MTLSMISSLVNFLTGLIDALGILFFELLIRCVFKLLIYIIILLSNIAKKIDYYCYSLRDFKDEDNISYENIPDLCDKFKIKKNLINPIYIS